MTNFYVDTEKLKKRNEAGLALREKIEEDLAALESDMATLMGKSEQLADADVSVGNLMDASDAHDGKIIEKLSESVQALKKLAENITSVCDYDSYAIKKYEEASRKIESLTDGVKL